jgi:hypothetical protein
MRIHHYLRYSMAVLLAVFAVFSLTAAERHGKVLFGGLPVPGATVTVSQGDKKVVAVTDEMGGYSFPDLAEGTWSFQVEMQGFTPVKQDVTVAAAPAAPPNPAAPLPGQDFELKMLPIAEMNAQASAPVVTGIPPAAAGSTTPPAAQAAAPNTAPPNNAKNNGKNNAKGGAPAASTGAGFQRADVQATTPAAPAPATESAVPGGDASQSPTELSQRATDGYLVNGSSVNGASSPFGFNPAIGNNRRGPRSLYNGMIGLTNVGNSNLNANTFSLTGQNTPKPETTQFTGVALFGGPVKIPHVVRNGPIFGLQYTWTRNRTGQTSSTLVPTQAERDGDFTQVINPQTGKPVQLVDFPNNIIPPTQISPQAMALLNLYPLPNFTGSNVYNYQIPLVTPTHVDSMTSRLQKQLGRKNSVNGLFAFTSTRSDTPSVLGFLDTNNTLGLNSNITWRHNFTPRFSGTFLVNFSRSSTRLTPFFENRVNIAGQAGITGDNQQPVNWGPPNISFGGSLIQGLSDSEATFNRNRTTSAGYASTWNHGRHNVTFGADFARQEYNVLSQTDPRGTFSFNNTAEGYDFASFLLGIPAASSIAFGNADKYFRSYNTDAYAQDDWRVAPGLTLLLGVRWQYSAPITELYGRLVNLDIAPGFTAVAPVLAGEVGSLTGQAYPDSLVRPDKHAFQPVLGLSWLPISGSSMLFKAGYQVNYNTSIYQSIANQMAQQSPLSTSLNVQNTPTNPLTLANGFNAAPNVTTNNFAVDPNLRVGYVQTWQASIQRDLPASLQMVVTYNGNKGTRSAQMFFPNTYPFGAVDPCPTCVTGYRYLTSNGNSTREAGSLQLRRRLHNGFTANLTYTYAKALDDSSGLGGGAFGGAAAQNWLDLSAEKSRSSFDQRHNAVLTLQYTTGEGIGGGTLVGGWKGQLLKEWTFVDAITVGSGLPLTPVYNDAIAEGGGQLGPPLRGEYTGASVYDAPSGHFLNPLAYVAPPLGQFGDAGRNSITGPSQFFMNANMARTFRMGGRLSLDLSLSATNVLNHVVISGWGTTVGTTQFGVPTGASPMRSVVTNLRMRF